MRQLREQVWNWLPAFLEVAESGSVIAASKNLHLTPAAVSRTLKLLEDALGEPVFNRVGRSLVLNSRGMSLRDAMREATLVVDRGLLETLADPFHGPLRVSSLGILTEHFVIASIIALKREHPGLVPQHVNQGTNDATEQLARGELDVAFYYEVRDVEGVAVERIGQTTMSVYCGKGHPLFSVGAPREDEVLAYDFSIPQIGDTGRVQDGWPTDLQRKVGLRITMLRSNVEVCRSGLALTVLPDVTALAALSAGEIRRVPFRALPPIDMYAARSAT